MSDDEARTLIERAFSGVRLEPCPTCGGAKIVGVAGVQVRCPTCRGSGKTTVRETDD